MDDSIGVSDECIDSRERNGEGTDRIGCVGLGGDAEDCDGGGDCSDIKACGVNYIVD